jgi:TatD DNase family protein
MSFNKKLRLLLGGLDRTIESRFLMIKQFIDSHSHLSDPRIETSVEEMIAQAKAHQIHQFLQGGVGPEDWERQKLLKKKHPEILLCFGLHPYWVADHNGAQLEEALDLLAREISQAQALGELGLDFRPHIMKDSKERQIHAFETQLEIAQMAVKPIVLHLVQAFEEAQNILDLFGAPQALGFVHSFNGSLPQAEAYLKRGLLLSVGGPVVRPDNQKLHQAVQAIPMDKLLIETDSPDQPPPRLSGQWNRPESLWDVAEMVGRLKKLPPEEVLDISSQNLRKLLA